jgi:hypothetical protein
MPNEKDRDEGRQEDEQIEQHDLNQGMDTGTHSTVKHGANWPASYRRKTATPAKQTPKEGTKRNNK